LDDIWQGEQSGTTPVKGGDALRPKKITVGLTTVGLPQH